MQALKNKLHRNKKNKSVEETTETVTTIRNEALAPVTETTRTTTVTEIDHTPSSSLSSSIPVPPPMPASNFWMQGSTTDYDRYFLETQNESVVLQNTKTIEVLPPQIIEKPYIIHESIRTEQVEEIQPIVEVEREKTEIRQIVQPLTDKEIKPVIVEQRTLPMEVLPTIQSASVPVVEAVQESTRTFETTVRQVVEKKPIIQETEKWRIIEEVQPIIYREVIIPHVRRVARPMHEVVVEAPLFAETILQQRDLHMWQQDVYSSYVSRSTVPRHDITFKDIPIIEAEGSLVLPITGLTTLKGREIITDTISTTTTTTVANTVGSVIPLATRSSTVPVSAVPVVLEKNHTETKLGGQTIIKDTVVTQTNNRPVLASAK